MSANYPSSLPVAGSASSSTTLAAAGHTALHNNGADEVRAVATKIGTGSSTPGSNTILRGTGSGTSAWSSVVLTTDVTGVLPVANGGTGTTGSTGTQNVVLSTGATLTTPTITTPSITTPTITSGGSWAGSPTITTPTIASFTNSQHDHSNAAGGGVLNTSVFNNPYKFSVYRAAAWTSANGTPGKVQFDTELFDTGSNFDSTTNFRFTAPIAGFYFFTGAANASVTASNFCLGILSKNGSEIARGSQIVTGTVTGSTTGQASALLQLTPGDYIEFMFYGTGGAGATGQALTYFQGFLVSVT